MSLIITRGLGSQSDVTGVPVIVDVSLVDSTTVRVEFYENVLLEPPSDSIDSWKISRPDGGQTVMVLAVTVSDNIVDIKTTEHSDDVTYVLTVPSLGITSAAFDGKYLGPFAYAYQGFAELPYILMVKGVDQTAIDVVFSEPVVFEEAILPENYVITGPTEVRVLSVSQITDDTFRLITTPQDRLAQYKLAVFNIHDLAGNAIISDHT